MFRRPLPTRFARPPRWRGRERVANARLKLSRLLDAVVLDLGADDYVEKPFGVGELLARLRVALRHRLLRQGAEPVVVAGDLTVDLVKRLAPLPEEPFEAFRGSWELIEAEIRTALPQDYKDFIRLYGNGYFMQFLGISLPRSRNSNVLLRSAIYWARRAAVDGGFPPEGLPYPFWPDRGGLLAFGSTDNGDTLLWLTEGEPEDWKVVVWDRGLGEFEVFDCGLTDFLASLATGAIRPKAFPDNLLPCEQLFAPNSGIAGKDTASTPGWNLSVRLQFPWEPGGFRPPAG